MRRWLIGGVVAVSATLGMVTTASAAPPGLEKRGGEAFVCDGEDVVIFTTSGRQGWIGDTLYLARSVHFEGTFTPADGGEPQTEVDDKTYGGGPAGDVITCTSSFTETDETGTFTGEVLVTAVRVPGH
jgi:hypothetical protein